MIAINEWMNKIKNDLELHNISSLIRKIRKKIGDYVYYSTVSTWYERKLENSLPVVIQPSDLEPYFAVHDKSEIFEWLDINKCRFPWIFSRSEKHFAQSYQHPYFIIKCKGDIIGYIKIGIGPTYINDYNKTVVFDPETAFIYDTFILPEYRGMNLTVFSLFEVLRYLKQQKYSRVICCIENWNHSSIVVFKKAGFTSQGSIRFIRIGIVSFYLLNGYIYCNKLEKLFNS